MAIKPLNGTIFSTPDMCNDIQDIFLFLMLKGAVRWFHTGCNDG